MSGAAAVRRVKPFGFAGAGILLVTIGLLACSAQAQPPAVSEGAKASLRSALKEADRGRWGDARRIAQRAKDPVVDTVVTWLDITRLGTELRFGEVASFLDAHPDWPARQVIEGRAEDVMDSTVPDRTVIAWFRTRTPTTANGMTRLATALMATGQAEQGVAMLRRAWVEGNFTALQERHFLREHRKWLRPADHEQRLDRLVWQGRTAPAQRMLTRVGKPSRELAEARLALREMKGNVDFLIRRLPREAQNDIGLTYERLRWRRRKGFDVETLDLFRKLPPKVPHAQLWWPERAIVARRLMADQRIKDAYFVVARHGMSKAEAAEFSEAEWLAGWIALRQLKQPGAALGHFQRMYDAVSYPVSRSRAAYWAGRAAEAQGRHAVARDWYYRAASFGMPYYGQLAATRADVEKSVPPGEEPPAGAREKAFRDSTPVRAAALLNAIGRSDLLRPFIGRLAQGARDATEFALVGRLAVDFGRIDLGVVVGRRAFLAGYNLSDLSYPVVKLPTNRPDPALIHAVMRQESNFETAAESVAGALGLMQLMPATAQLVAGRIKLPYARDRLTLDPDYNIRLGSAYLESLIDRFGGSYLLAVAAYNAGPGNVAKWIKEIGDPRTAGIDVIDWVEAIPFAETRNYVQRVLENVQVYRRKFAGDGMIDSIEQDLRRGIGSRG